MGLNGHLMLDNTYFSACKKYFMILKKYLMILDFFKWTADKC